MKTNKWILEQKDHYTIGGKTIVRSESVAIPPTSGDRVDIIGESGKYYYGMTKEKFMERLTPEEYLELELPGLEGEERARVLKSIDWTPRRFNDQIAIIIEIKNGEITLKAK